MARFASLVFAAACTTPSLAHVTVNSPNGGELLTINETFTLEWEVLIRHDTLNWDVYYSTVASDGPWTPIALDLPPGDTSPGSIHTFDWLVDGDPADTAWLRVVQDNSARDYEDVSDDSFTIAPAPGAFSLLGLGMLIAPRTRRR